MWLINTRTLKLEEFWSEELTPYAILSHRWGDGEVSFKDIQQLDVAASKKGFIKIRKSCELALKDKLEYVWVDTCCINKESSAELSEAINSMFRWYQSAAVCYAFLSDIEIAGAESIEAEIQKSVWFTRGWTLQELLAPKELMFYDQSWNVIGTKRGLANILYQRTGISVKVLSADWPLLSDYSIAHRMSWASRRTTTRKEDLAYCLLGIFDVNMPLLYGEGDKAFIRLQEEIIKRSDDHSIFAWPMPPVFVSILPQQLLYGTTQPGNKRGGTGLLATSPAAFAACGNILALSLHQGHPKFSITNRGLSCKFPAKPYMTDTYLVRLDCTDEGTPGLNHSQHHHPTYLGIFLRRLREDDQYARVPVEGESMARISSTATNSSGAGFMRRNVLVAAEGIGANYWDMSQPDWALSPTDLAIEKIHPKTIRFNVRQEASYEDWYEAVSSRCNGFHIVTDHSSDNISFSNTLFGTSDCDYIKTKAGGGAMCSPPGKYGYIGTLYTAFRRWVVTHLKLGFDFDGNPLCFVTESNRPNEGFRKFEEAWIWEDGGIPFDGHVRSKIDAKGYAWDVERYPGLWAIKGDRREGVSVKLAYGHRGVLAYPVCIEIERRLKDSKWVWEVHLWNT
ncbi:MAG: hypothetical protein Q9226_003370 [Calogaya cf. arnoldii]